MSGTPTETELQTQWRNCVDILEKTRVHADGLAAASGELDVLEKSLEGEYTPAALSAFSQSFRAGLSSLVDPGRALEALNPILFEYGKLMSEGSGYRDTGSLMRALYEHFITNSLTVKSREITYDTTAVAPAGFTNVGNGEMVRLTEDENGYDLEACHVETKRFRCRSDQNTGEDEQAEVFEFLSDPVSYDNLLSSQSDAAQLGGSGLQVFFRAKHAGTGEGGSILRNSSFTTYDATAINRFTGWAASFGGAAVAADVTQDTTNTYRGSPGTTAANDASLKISMDASGDTVTLKQTLPVAGLDPFTPYFYRIMVNKTIGSAAGGTVTIRLGSKTAAATIANLSANWDELRIGDAALAGSEDPSDCWFKNFNQDGLDVEIEWTGGTSGFILVDDAILAPWDEIDGTFWALRATHATAPVPWAVDDVLEITDTGGAPATAEIQWWLFRAGLGYLPHSPAVITFADPA
jgi:hypothetical protein